MQRNPLTGNFIFRDCRHHSQFSLSDPLHLFPSVLLSVLFLSLLWLCSSDSVPSSSLRYLFSQLISVSVVHLSVLWLTLCLSLNLSRNRLTLFFISWSVPTHIFCICISVRLLHTPYIVRLALPTASCIYGERNFPISGILATQKAGHKHNSRKPVFRGSQNTL